MSGGAFMVAAMRQGDSSRPGLRWINVRADEPNARGKLRYWRRRINALNNPKPLPRRVNGRLRKRRRREPSITYCLTFAVVKMEWRLAR